MFGPGQESRELDTNSGEERNESERYQDWANMARFTQLPLADYFQEQANLAQERENDRQSS